MAGTTTHTPMTVNDLMNKLKLLPADMKIEVSNSDGLFYIDNLEVIDECTSYIILKPIP